MADPALERLCEAHGIAVRYRDIWQEEHETPERTLRAVLAAMGLAAEGPTAAMPGPEPGAAALVWRAGSGEPKIRLDLAAEDATGTLDWRVAFEGGGQAQGRCTVVPAGHPHRPSLVEIACNGWADDAPQGYHALTLVATGRGAAAVAALPFIACPPRCTAVQAGQGNARLFGPAVQLYSLRSRRNWGIGDFTDLALLARVAARHGAGFVGLNPLHELFIDRPAQASPYSPSCRLTLNPLYLDIEAIEDFDECAAARERVGAPGFQSRLAALRAAALVDYTGVAAAKLEVLQLLFAHFQADHLSVDTPRARAFRAFADDHAERVRDPALFDALQESLARGDASVWGWPAWPADYRDRDAAPVQEFARRHADAVDFHLYLQWHADRQLEHAARAARAAGMPVGLYRDLAVGANPGGADTWHDPARFAMAMHVGAPPDEFNQKGQDWGLPPWIPGRLPAGGYAPWVALLRANMRHAGGLRIDHVMALLRLFWIPDGSTPAEGTYVGYPLDALLAVLALESVRNACFVVGEDLGTVPDAVRTALRDGGVQSYRVLYFERDGDGEFLAPAHYPAQALVTVSTHDLPTLQGFWQASDLASRDALDLFPSDALRTRQQEDRSADRSRLLRALGREGLRAEAAQDTLSFEQVCAVHAYAARTPCTLMTLQLEDVFGESLQVNLTATTDDQYPNWRRKIPVDLEDWTADGRFAALCAAVRAQGRGIPERP